MTVIFIIVLAILMAAVMIPFVAKASSSLGLFSDDKISQDDETLFGELIPLTDKNLVNIDTSIIDPLVIKSFDLTSPAIPPFTCPAPPANIDEVAMCNGIDVSLSASPPKYTYIPEGISVIVSFQADAFEGVDGYSEINIPLLYELDRAILSGGGDIPSCVNPFEQTCYVAQVIPPVPTDIMLRVKVGQDISMRIPFYYDNLADPNTGFNNEDACTDQPEYSGIELQATKLSVTVEGPSYPYEVTVIHMEKPHEREYALHCIKLISDNTPVSFDVQVVAGDYDYFRIYGWNDPSCVKSLDKIPVLKGTTKDVTLKFDC